MAQPKGATAVAVDESSTAPAVEKETTSEAVTVAVSGEPPSPETLAAEYKEHVEDLTEVVAKFATSYNAENPKKSHGLTTEEANRRLKIYGLNVLTPPYQKPEWLRFLEKFGDRFILLLLFAGALSMALAKEDMLNLYLGIILFVVCIAACTLSYREEGKVASLMDTFRKMLPKCTKVMRDGHVHEIPADQLVVGDIVVINSGDQVPADIRLLSSTCMRVECSSLTGESDAIPINSEVCEDKTTPPHEATNIAFSSSLVIEGTAVGVVVRTSDQTLLGRIANVAMGVEKGKTTLELEIDRLINFISVLAIVMGLVVFIASVAQGEDPAFAFVNGFVVIIIANVPQGLQLTVIVALNVSGRKLAAKNVYVKSLNTIETLGSASCICTDKTGTLTQNVMSACHLWVGGQVHHANQLTQGETSLIHWERNPHLRTIVNIATICNKAQYDDPKFTLFNGGAMSASEIFKLSLTNAAAADCPTEDNGDVKTNNKESSTKITVQGRSESSMIRLGSHKPSLSRVPSISRQGSVNRMPSNALIRRSSISVAAMAAKTAPKPVDESNVKCTGDASDVGLMKFCDKISPVYQTRAGFDVCCEVPFNSSNKYSACIIRPPSDKEDQRRVMWLKGAPEIVLAMCDKYVVDGTEKPIDAAFMERYEQAYKSFAKQGERVLGFAQTTLDLEKFPASHDSKYVPGTEDFPALEKLTFVGLISLVDPPRVGVKEAVATCRKAGVKVIMVTGDHPLTGGAIARKVGIINDYFTQEEVAEAQGIKLEEVDPDHVGAIVVHGHKLNGVDEARWDHILSHQEIVFARTTPEQKLEIVKHCQRLGEIVAVTGDGVNDAPALRQANIGIAMGTVGSDVSRDAANVVLVTNDWASIVHGIEEGRVIFDNLVKSIAYTLTHLWPEVFPSILALVFGFPFLISSILVLCIDLATDMIPAISLAYEPAEPGIMERPPRDMKNDRLVTKQLLSYAYLEAGVIELCAALLSAFLVLWHYDIGLSTLYRTEYFSKDSRNLVISSEITYPALEQLDIINQAHAAYFIGLVGSQVTHIWVCRSRLVNMWQLASWNMVCGYGVLIEILLMLIIVYMPFTQKFFTTANPPAQVWAAPLLFMGLVWPFVEGRKWWVQKHPEGKVAHYFTW